MQQGQKHLPARATAERYRVVLRTLNRWLDNPKMNFPRPLLINGRRYFKEAELEDWERSQAAAEAATGTAVEAA